MSYHLHICILFTAILSSELTAGPFRLVNRTYGTNNVTELDRLFNEVEDSVNESLPDTDHSQYLTGIANATTFSSQGLGVDYANSFSYFIVGGGLGFGADPGTNKIADVIKGDVDKSRLRGFALQSSVMAGIKFKRLKLYANYLSKDLGGNVPNFSSDFKSLGFHAQLQLIKPVSFLPFGFFEWGGLEFTTGIRNSVVKAVFEKDIEKEVEKTVDGVTAIGSIKGKARFGAETDVRSIPLELSSSFRYLYLFTTYFGGGYLSNRGTSKTVVDFTGDLTLSGGSITNGAGATAQLDLGDEGAPAKAPFYVFAGQQFNLTLAKIYFHVASSPKTNAVGFSFGARFGI